MQKHFLVVVLCFFIATLTYGQDAPLATLKGTLMTTDAGFLYTETVIAKNIETGKEVKTKKGNIVYKTEFKAVYTLKVSPGKYYVYLKSRDNDPLPAYYTEFVMCGLKSGCPSHKKIVVEAVAGKTLSKIDPQDVYYTDPKQLEGGSN